MNFIKKLFRFIYYIFIICLIGVAVILFLSAYPKGKYKSFIVLSGSMEPAIKTGSVVLVHESDNYQIGDVITFGEASKTKTPTTHRIVDINRDGDEEKYITKGDSNNAEDNKQISKDEVIGKVLFSVPYVGYAVSAAQKPVGFVLIIVVPAVIIIYDEILNIKKEVLKKINYKERMKKRKEDKDKEKDDEEKEV
ncbi:MAG: signal peptidase I [Candidatus Moranbacteria bacterium]|nr:signal peptidase I [Candidatus Moranbacteria bacterium]